MKSLLSRLHTKPVCSILINSKAQQSTNNDCSGQIVQEIMMETRSSTHGSDYDDMNRIYTAEDFTPSPASDMEITETSGSPTKSEKDYPTIGTMRTCFNSQAALVLKGLNELEALAIDPYPVAEDGIRKYEEDLHGSEWIDDIVNRKSNVTHPEFRDNSARRALEPYRTVLEMDKIKSMRKARQLVDAKLRDVGENMAKLDECAKDFLADAKEKLYKLAKRSTVPHLEGGDRLGELREGLAIARKSGGKREQVSVETGMLSLQIQIAMAEIVNTKNNLNNNYIKILLKQVIEEVSMNVPAPCLNLFT